MAEKVTATGCGRKADAVTKPLASSLVGVELLMLAVVLVWALNFPFAKWAMGKFEPIPFNAVRFVFATAAVLATFPFVGRWQPVARGDWLRLVILGVSGNVIYQTCFVFGLKLTTAGNSAIIWATMPLWTALFGAVFYRERIGRVIWLGMALAFGGIVLITVGSGKQVQFGSTAIWGDLLQFTATALWGWNMNYQKPLVDKYPTTQVVVVTLAIGAVCLPFVAVPSALRMDWTQLTAAHWAVTALSGAFSVGITSLIWVRGLKRLGPSRAANFVNLVPVIALAVSLFVLREPYTSLQLLGAGSALCGVWIARRSAATIEE
jgi:drug/metabolite transporter (DMT)-like permease